MGRKIPKSRKHNKLKSVDPCAKLTLNERKKGLYNLPPENLNGQHMPRKLLELIRMKNLAETKKVKKKKRKYHNDYISVRSDKYEEHQKGMTQPLKYIPEKMKQRANESESHFLWRIQQMTNHSMAEAQMEEKYGIDYISKEGGLDMSSAVSTTKPTHKQLKRKLIEQKKKEKKKKKKEDRIDDYGHLIDEVKFGETVIEPPKLITLKGAKLQLKAGQKQLKLKSSDQP